jgi:hypothetical protein
MRAPALSFAAFCLFGSLACSSSNGSSPATTHPHSKPAVDASAPFDPQACTQGTRPSQLQQKCVPVGPTQVPVGFLAADDWGFHAIRPALPCTGATRGPVGTTVCIPIDDCSAAFPPSNANVVVGGTATLPKGAVRASSIADALSMAGPGATIGVDEGVYDETVVVAKDVTLTGRCATKVVIMGTSGTAISVEGASLSMQSITVQGFDTAVLASGGKVSLSKVYLTGNGSGLSLGGGASGTVASCAMDGDPQPGGNPILGVIAQAESHLEVSDSDIRGMDQAYTAFNSGTSISVTRSLAITPLGTESTVMFLAMVGGTITIDHSVLGTNAGTLGIVGQSYMYSTTRDTARVQITDSEINQTGAFYDDSILGVEGGAALFITNSTIEHESEGAISAAEPMSGVTLQNVAILGSPQASSAAALTVISGATADVVGSAIVGERGGAVVEFASTTNLTFNTSLVTGTTEGLSSTSWASLACALVVGVDAVATVHDSSFVNNQQVALSVNNSASLDVEDSLILNTTTSSPDGILGEGIIATAEGQLTLNGSLIQGSADAALVIMRSGGIAQSSKFEGNAAVVNIWESTVSNGAPPSSRPTTAMFMVDDTYVNSGPETRTGQLNFDPPGAPTN